MAHSRRDDSDLYTVEDGWIETYTGLQFYFGDPADDQICIEDIAHALSMLCRYNGHTDRFYSVAEHSVLIAGHLHHGMGMTDRRVLLAALLHDAAEAYIGDLARPIKYSAGLEGFKALEGVIDRAVFRKFGLPYPFPELIKRLDSRILVDETAQAMPRRKNDWGVDGLEPLGVTVKFWNPDEAEQAFLKMYDSLTLGR